MPAKDTAATSRAISHKRGVDIIHPIAQQKPGSTFLQSPAR